MKGAHIHSLLASLVALGLSQGMQRPAKPAEHCGTVGSNLDS
jgi:hypothetical protein